MPHDVAKVALRYHITDALHPPEPNGAVTFHVHKAATVGGWSEAELEVLCGRVYQWWADPDPPDDAPFDNLRALYTADFVLDDITAHGVTPAIGAPVVVDVLAPANVGTSGQTMSLPQAAFVLGLRTDTDTRQGRGRMYLPAVNNLAPFTVAFTPWTGFLNPAMQDRLGELGALLASRIRSPDIGADPWVLCVFSRVVGDSNAVLRFAATSRVCTQRRRAAPAENHALYGLDGAPVA